MEYYMDNNKISDLQDFIPQIDTMKNRMTKSAKWFESVGNRSAFWDPDFAVRQQQVCSDFITGAQGVIGEGRSLSERALVLGGNVLSHDGIASSNPLITEVTDGVPYFWTEDDGTSVSIPIRAIANAPSVQSAEDILASTSLTNF